MTLPNNSKTAQIERGNRIAVGRNVYKVISYDNYSSSDQGLVRLSMLEDKETDLDDVLNGIADNYERPYIDEGVVTDPVIEGYSNVTINYPEFYNAIGEIGETFTFEIDPQGTPEEAYSLGIVSGTCASVRCFSYMDDFYTQYKVLLKATNNTTSVVSTLELTFRGVQ